MRQFYVCFDAVRKGFVDGCRKYLAVDGCFMKTWIKAKLLVAMGKDENNQMYPIAWGVVEKEDQHSWGWFLGLVDRDIGIGDGAGWSIMSDQQKGLELVVKNLFPNINHKNCARHIYANFRKRGYTGVNYRKHFWAAAKSTTEESFEENMNEIKKLSEAAYDHLMARDPSRWCRAFFPTDVPVDSVDNNVCESFNFWILEARYKPLITMLEDIRKQVMVRMRVKRDYMRKRLAEGQRFGHRVCKALKESIVQSRDCQALWNGERLYEIGGKRGGTTVDLRARTCTCRAWQLSGIPCCHAISAITCTRKEPEKYIHDCFKGDTYLKCYAHMLQPLNGVAYWPKSDKPVLLPPPARVFKGRPKWNRRKDATEDGGSKSKGKDPVEPVEEPPFKIQKTSRKGIKMTCSICKSGDHNRRKCPQKPIDEIPNENEQGVKKGATGKASGSGSKAKKVTKSKLKSDQSNGIPGSGPRGGKQQQNGSAHSGVNTRSMTNSPQKVGGLQSSFNRRGKGYITSSSLLQQKENRQQSNSRKRPRE